MEAGHRIAAVSGREATRARVHRYLRYVPFLSDAEAAEAGDVVIIGVPDEAIADICSKVVAARAVGSGKAVLHLSGSVSLDVLEPAGAAGATVLSLHPLQSAPDVDDAVNRFPGSAMAVTSLDDAGYRLGERLARDAGGRPLRLADERKPLYHAAAVFASNYLVVVEAVAQRLFRLTGLENTVELLAPLTRATLENFLSQGAAALTGPAARGDAETIRRNLEALESQAPDAIPAYIALARAALDLAEDSGKIDADGRARVEEVLAWR
jgi:predicted short-subunit dehydrogenase-like oxidoreductase (DUF2520 family)